MAYNLKLAERIRDELSGIPFVEKTMFGGVGFLIHGNIACGIYREDLIVRVNPENHNNLFKKTGVKPFDITGKPMKGWLMVEPEGCKTTRQLSAWVKEVVEFALILPPK